MILLTALEELDYTAIGGLDCSVLGGLEFLAKINLAEINLAEINLASWQLQDFVGLDLWQWIVLSLGHAIWQATLLAVGLSWLLHGRWFERERSFRAALLVLLLIGMLPIANFVWLSQTSDRAAVPLPVYPLDAAAGTNLPSPDRQESRSSLDAESDISITNRVEAWSLGEINVPPVFPSEIAGDKKRSTSFATNPTDLAIPKTELIRLHIHCSIAFLYLAGVLLMTYRITQSVKRHRVVRKLLDNAESELLQQVREIANRAANKMGWHGRLRIGLVAGSATAVVMGCLRPVILVNLTLAIGLTPRQLEQILAHELAHLWRLDPLTLFLQRLVETTQFYNPAMWIISGQVSELRELCCDQRVARHYDSTEYAETLVECATWEQELRHPMALSIFGTNANALRQRVCVLLDPSVAPGHRSLRSWLGWKKYWNARPRQRAKMAIEILVGTGSMVAVLMGLGSSNFKGHVPDWPWQKPAHQEIDKVALAFRSQSLTLTDQLPLNIRVDAMVDSEACQFTQWQFGNRRSKPVTLMVEMFDDQPSQIYLDRNRDGIIESSELITESIQSQVWVTNLDVEIRDHESVLHVDRSIAIAFTSDLKSVRIASLGYAEGKLDVGNRQLACRRMDNDGDGIPLGWRDELWIDVNDDGLFDEISERFNYQPWLEIEKIKYGLQSDPFGQELRLINAPALGTVEFRLNLADPAAQVIDWQGIFRDRFGSFVPMQMDRSTVEVLPGEYCIESLAVTVKDGSGDQWYLIMSRLADANWFKIEENQNRSIELLSNLEMKIEPKISFGGNGEEVAIFTPYLISSDGLVMTEFKRNSTEGISLNLSMSRPELPQDSEGPMVSCSGFS